MKTPLTYYGGKQQLASIIISLIPFHRLYCEPFTGGGAIFFEKKPSEIEILNDKNKEVMNFYDVLQNNYDDLLKEIETSLHSRTQHRHANVIYNNPDLFDRIKRAWSIWILGSSSYGSKLDAIWGYDLQGKKAKKINSVKNNFSRAFSRRLKNVYIECYEALKVIKDNDAPDSFFYIDPPYVGADQGHYAGYKQSDFDKLLDLLSQLKGKFILSSYQNIRFKEYLDKNCWYQIKIDMNSSMGAAALGYKSIKTEVLTANYPIYKCGTQDLFS
jgi:DNA adenine methylase